MCLKNEAEMWKTTKESNLASKNKHYNIQNK